MMMVLFLWPIGVKKAQEAATATPIKNGSGAAPMASAIEFVADRVAIHGLRTALVDVFFPVSPGAAGAPPTEPAP